jgi:hypothetical protein
VVALNFKAQFVRAVLWKTLGHFSFPPQDKLEAGEATSLRPYLVSSKIQKKIQNFLSH